MILVTKTGHVDFNSSCPQKTAKPLDKFEGCKVCNSHKTKCSTCKIMFFVCGVDGIFHSLSSAVAAEDKHINSMKEIISSWQSDFCDVRFYLKTEKPENTRILHAEILCVGGETLDKICEPKNSTFTKEYVERYAEEYCKAVERYDKFLSCECVDKQNGICDKYGCLNGKCFYNMINNDPPTSYQEKRENLSNQYTFN